MANQEIFYSVNANVPAPLDGRTLYNTIQEALEDNPIEEIPIESWEPDYNDYPNHLRPQTNRFIGQKMMIRNPPEGDSPREYWFRDGIADADLVEYDSYEWEKITPGGGSGGGGSSGGSGEPGQYLPNTTNNPSSIGVVDDAFVSLVGGSWLNMAGSGHISVIDGGHIEISQGGHLVLENSGGILVRDSANIEMRQGGTLTMRQGGAVEFRSSLGAPADGYYQDLPNIPNKGGSYMVSFSDDRLSGYILAFNLCTNKIETMDIYRADTSSNWQTENGWKYYADGGSGSGSGSGSIVDTFTLKNNIAGNEVVFSFDPNAGSGSQQHNYPVVKDVTNTNGNSLVDTTGTAKVNTLVPPTYIATTLLNTTPNNVVTVPYSELPAPITHGQTVMDQNGTAGMITGTNSGGVSVMTIASVAPAMPGPRNISEILDTDVGALTSISMAEWTPAVGRLVYDDYGTFGQVTSINNGNNTASVRTLSNVSSSNGTGVRILGNVSSDADITAISNHDVGDSYLASASWTSSSYSQLNIEHPNTDGNDIDIGDLIVWQGSAWQNVGNIQGPPGQPGQPGASGATPNIGENSNWWINGTDTGVQAQGPAGQDGTGVIVKGRYDTLANFQAAQPTGSPGDAYIVYDDPDPASNGIWSWDSVESDWKWIGEAPGGQGGSGAAFSELDDFEMRCGIDARTAAGWKYIAFNGRMTDVPQVAVQVMGDYNAFSIVRNIAATGFEYDVRLAATQASASGMTINYLAILDKGGPRNHG